VGHTGMKYYCPLTLKYLIELEHSNTGILIRPVTHERVTQIRSNGFHIYILAY
jgi:hypothetical protein